MSLTITSITRSAPGVVALHVDVMPTGGGAHDTDNEGGDGRAHLLPLEALILHRLHEGTTLPEADWERIRSEGALLLATRRGLEVLARRQCTERELRAELHDFEEPDVDRALERLHEMGYLDDAAWAERYVSSDRGRARGRLLLRQELRARGVTDTVAVEALDGRDEYPAALQVAGRRARSLRSLDADRRERRLYDFLRRRGFTDDVARRALRDALAEIEAADTPA